MARAPLVRTLFLAALCVAGAAQAGTVYIPVPGNATVGTASYQVQVAVANTGAQTVNLKQVLLPTDTDGTQRPNLPGTTQILAGRTTVLQPGGAFKGLLELSGGNTVAYTARLAGSGPGRLGVYLPVITSSNQVAGRPDRRPPGSPLGLRPVRRPEPGQPLAHRLAVHGHPDPDRRHGDRHSGHFRPQAALPPVDRRHLLRRLGQRGARRRHLHRNFFAFALVSDAATGEITYIGPAGSGASTLTLPGQPAACPAGATCFDAKGIVHQPTPANPVHRVQFPAPAGIAKRLRMSLDVTVGPWYPNDPAGKHLIYWFVLNRNFDMAGHALLPRPPPPRRRWCATAWSSPTRRSSRSSSPSRR